MRLRGRTDSLLAAECCSVACSCWVERGAGWQLPNAMGIF